MALLVYADDLVLIGNNYEVCSKFKQYLNNCFKIKDLATLKYFLGIEVVEDHKDYFCINRSMP